MTSSDPRVRANSIESIWGGGNSNARRCLINALRDGHPLVPGNALMGLHLLGDRPVRSMLQHEKPGFRVTAAWVMGKIGAPEFRGDLKRALLDPNAHVRSSAARAMKLLPPEPIAPGSPADAANSDVSAGSPGRRRRLRSPPSRSHPSLRLLNLTQQPLPSRRPLRQRRIAALPRAPRFILSGSVPKLA